MKQGNVTFTGGHQIYLAEGELRPDPDSHMHLFIWLLGVVTKESNHLWWGRFAPSVICQNIIHNTLMQYNDKYYKYQVRMNNSANAHVERLTGSSLQSTIEGNKRSPP